MVCLVVEKMEIKKKEAQFHFCLLNCLYFDYSYTGFFLFFNGNGWVEFGYIFFGLNGPQWVFS